MVRLTRRAEVEGIKAVYYGKKDVFLEGEPGYAEAEKLAHYEDLAEAGRLVVLPKAFDKEKFIYSNCPSYLLLKDHCNGDCKTCWEAALESLE